MFYGANDDDDSDFNIVGSSGSATSSKLANLFSSDQQPVQDQSLFYVPPKQPKKPAETAQSSSTLSVIVAFALHAYKLSRESGKYVNQGKLGAALLGNHQLRVYKFILYTGKKQEVASVSITPAFILTVQANNYVNFYDDRKENWSVVFDNEQTAVDFAKQIALAKANSAGENLKTLIVQDLVPGEGEGLETGDAAEIGYTGCLLTNNAVGQVFDSNLNSGKLLRVKLGKGKANKALEEGLIGAKKSGRRFLVIPPSYEGAAQGFEQKVPPGSTLLFDITISKVKHGQQRSRSCTPIGQEDNSSDSALKKPDVVPKPHSGSINDDTIRSRGASLSEQLSQSPKSEKAKIISRMAKMGMPMLPMQGATPAQPSSDSEIEDEVRSKSPTPTPVPLPRGQSPKPSPKPRTASASSVGSVSHHPIHPIPTSQPVQQMSLYQPAPQYPGAQPYPYGYQPPGTMPPQFPMYQQQSYMNPTIPVPSPVVSSSVNDSHIPLLLSESRSQNTELRMSLSKLTDKVDTVLSKLNEVKNDQAVSVMGASMPYMESSILMSNIQRIVQENSRLKKDLEEKTKKIENLNEKICDLLQKNQRFMEESQMLMEQRSDTFLTTASQSQARLLSVEQDKVKLAAELGDALSKLSTLQSDIARYQKVEEELRHQLQNASLESARHKEETEVALSQHQKQQKEFESMEQTVKSLSQEKKILEDKIVTLEAKIADMTSAVEASEKASGADEKQIQELQQQHSAMIAKLKEMHEKELQALREGRLQSESKVRELQSKLQQSESSLKSNQQLINQLRAEVENLSVWKTKYDHVYKSAQSMKEKYEQRIQQWAAEVRKLKAAESSGETQSASPLGGENFETELKKIMNALYKLLQMEIQKEGNYSGSDVLRIILEKVRLLTLRLLESRAKLTEVTNSGAEETKNKMEESQTKAEQKNISDAEVEAAKIPLNSEAQVSANSNPEIEQSSVAVAPSTEELTSQDVDPKATEPSEEQITSSKDNSSLQNTNPDIVEDSRRGTDVPDAQVKENADENMESKKPAQSESSLDPAVKDPDLLLGVSPVSPDTPDSGNDASKKYLFFDTKAKVWRPQPPPPPLFDEDEEDEDDWLK